jgi:nucleolar protein 9
MLRDSFAGRIVWRNWSLDLFKRRRGEWVNKIKSESASHSPSRPAILQASEVAFDEGAVKEEGKEGKKSKDNKQKKDNKSKLPQESFKGKGNTGGKSAIQLAREKFAAAKVDKITGTNSKPAFKAGRGRGTGANAT